MKAMARKLLEFPPFDIIEIYKELKEKGITPFKWFTEEIEKLLPPPPPPPPPEEVTIEIDLIPDELPLTINENQDFKTLLKEIKSFEDEGFNITNDDLRREIDLEFEVQIYVQETGEVVTKSLKPIISRPKYVQEDTVILNRKKWTIELMKKIYKGIIKSVIKRYKKTFGIESPPGENTGSNDWRLKINYILFSAKYEE